MVESGSDTAFDVESYRASTDELVDSMQETTELMHEMADNMATLSDSFEAFDTTRDDLRTATMEMQQSGPPAAAD